MTLWTALERLMRPAASLSRRDVEALFLAPLEEIGSNSAFQFFATDGAAFEGRLPIDKLEVRVRRETERAELVILSVAQAQIPRPQVQDRYPRLTLTSVPRGRSLEESTEFSTETSSGRLTFGFKESDPQRLAWIAFAAATKDA